MVTKSKAATQSDIDNLKTQMESRLYTALSEMEGRMSARFDEILKAIKEHRH